MNYPFKIVFNSCLVAFDNLTLTPSNTGTTFWATLSPFLLAQEAFAVNKFYPIQILVDNKYYYLNLNNNNRYDLSETETGFSLGFQFNQTCLSWCSALNQNQVTFTNLNLDNPYPVTFIKTTNNTDLNILVVNLSDCSGNANFCGAEICPANFSSNSAGDCVSDLSDNTTFGLRFINCLTTKIITYEINNRIITLKYVDLDTTDREQWFYVDNKTLFVGTSYPIFVLTNQKEKLYLKWSRQVDANTSEWIGTSSVTSGNFLIFTPSLSGFWNSFVFPPSDFSNLRLPSGSLVSLKQNVSLNNTLATVNPPSSSSSSSTDFAGNKTKSITTKRPNLPPLSADKTSSRIRPRGNFTNLSTPINNNTATIDWIWSIILIISLIIIFIVVLFALWRPAPEEEVKVIPAVYTESEFIPVTPPYKTTTC